MITINLDKAKTIGHNIRREQRAKEFLPFDEVIIKQIPGKVEEAEAARQVIRDKYAEVQFQIDAASTPEEIKVALGI